MAALGGNLDGIRNMEGPPTSLVIVDPRRERIAVEEAFKLIISGGMIAPTENNKQLRNG